MASEAQSRYITDLVVIKTKEFKEVKEMLVANEIVSSDAELIQKAESIAEINHSLTDLQASKFIDVLVEAQTPTRSRVYSDRRIERAVAALDDIKATIRDWEF